MTTAPRRKRSPIGMASPLHIADVHAPASQAAALSNAVAAWQRCLLRCAAQRSKISRASRPTFRKLFARFISKQDERREQLERCPDSFDGIHAQAGSAVIRCASAVAARPRPEDASERDGGQRSARGGGGRSADALGGPAGAEGTRDSSARAAQRSIFSQASRPTFHKLVARCLRMMKRTWPIGARGPINARYEPTRRARITPGLT